MSEDEDVHDDLLHASGGTRRHFLTRALLAAAGTSMAALPAAMSTMRTASAASSSDCGKGESSQARFAEPILDPMLPHLRKHARYLLTDLMADVNAGHNVQATVFVDSHAMYRTSGPESMKSVGEVEFANGAAAMGASGIFGNAKVCAGIVGNVD